MTQPKENRTLKSFFLIISTLMLIMSEAVSLGASNRQFYSVYSTNDLSSVKVNNFYQSSDGLIWIATQSGLDLYDGYKFRHFFFRYPNDDSNASNNGVTDVEEDQDGNLWIRHNRQTIYFNRTKEKLTELPLQLPELAHHYSTEWPFHLDAGKRLWLTDGSCLYCFSPEYKLLHKYKLSIDGDLHHLKMVDNSGTLYLFDNAGKVYSVTDAGPQLLPSPQSWVIPQDWYIILTNRDKLWIGSGSTTKLWNFNLNSHNWASVNLPDNLSKSNALRQMAADKDGNIWIATDHEGIFVYDPFKETFTQHYSPDFSSNQHSIPSNNVSSIFFDSNDNLWVGFDKHGIRVSSLSPRGISDSFNPVFGDVKSLLHDRLGRLWIGTDGRGLFLKKTGEESLTKCSLPNISVMSLLEDHSGKIIAGTYDHGIYILDTNGAIRHLSAKNGDIPNDRAWFLNEDREGKIWVASSMANPYIINRDGTFTQLKFSYWEDIRALSTYYDGGDSVFMSTGYGYTGFNIHNLQPGPPHISNRKGDLPFRNNFICAMWKDTDDIMWLGHQDGLTAWKLDTDSVYHFSHKEGMGQAVSLIMEDNNRRIWVGTSNGVTCISKSFTGDNKVSFSLRSFFESDGLRSNYVTTHSNILAKNGDIMFGGVDGYTTISPPVLFSSQTPLPQILFTGLKRNNEYVEIDSIYDGFSINTAINKLKTLRFNETQDNLTIEFASSDVINNHERWYAYKIVNSHEKDSEWIVTHDNSITLSHLQPGDYSLFVKPYKDSSDLNSSNSALLDIVIAKPIYLRWWAILIYILILASAVFIWLHYQKKRNLTRITGQAERYIEESKLRFFTNVSHDLRTQLTLVLSPLQLLEKEQLSPETKNKVGDIRHNAEILLDQINSLLDFRKLDAGGETLTERTCEVAPFISELFSRFESYAGNKNINYSLILNNCDCYLTLDFDKIVKIVTNLISNAFKYTPEGGSIEVNASVKATDFSVETLVISVSDTGKGIKNEEKQKIFDRFYQTDHSSGETGSGIGLHIVKEYLNLMEGDVTVQDNSPKGSVFTVYIPSRKADSQDEETETAKELPVTVLFVDDNENLRQMVKEGLSPYYNVITASDGREALEKLKNTEVNIVVSDVMMPGVDGYELCQAIKNDINYSHIPVILLTARTTDIHRKEGLELGADDYLTKPFNFDILRLRIDKFIEISRDRHQSFHNQVEVNPSEITITSLDAELMEKALKIVEENISDGDFSVNTLSDKLAMSRSSLYKKIMAITGAGPADFIRIIRLKRACQLLKESGLRVSEIAYMVGFNSPKRFSVNFKAEYGVTPSEYQQKYTNIKPNPQNSTILET